MNKQELSGPAGEWLRPLRELYEQKREYFESWSDDQARWDKLCELNVIAQVGALSRTPLIERAWDRGQELAVHGWIYDLRDGRLQDLNVTITSKAEAESLSSS
jgi:carbonic anhydrase